MPQTYENFRLKSGEGLSVTFLFIWLVGDVTGFIGAYIQHLAPTVQALAGYFAFADLILLSQVWWYRRRIRLHPELYEVSDACASHISNPEQAPLLGASEHTDYGMASDDLTSRPKRMSERTRETLLWVATIGFIVVFSLVGWNATLASQRPTPGHHGAPPPEHWNNTAQTVGWVSAALYLGARIPQLIKNTRTKCLGLSLGFFFLSILGNVTYSLSILVPSLERNHIVVNLAWLVGSAGTLVLDFAVLAQFWLFARERRQLVAEGKTGEE